MRHVGSQARARTVRRTQLLERLGCLLPLGRRANHGRLGSFRALAQLGIRRICLLGVRERHVTLGLGRRRAILGRG